MAALTALLVAGLMPAAMGMHHHHHQSLAHVRSRAPLPSGRLVPHASFPQPTSHLPHASSASSASDDVPPFRMRRKKQHHQQQQQQQQQKTRLQQHSLRGSDVTTRRGHGHAEAWLAAATLAAACSSLVLHQQHTALAVLSVATLVAVAAPSMLADVVRQVVDHLTTLQHASSVVRPSVPVPATPQAFTVYRQRPGPLIPFATATAVGAPAYGVQTRSSPDNGKRPPDGAALFLYNDTLHSGGSGSGSSGVLSRGVGTYSSTYNGGGSGGSSVLAMSAVDEEGALKAQEIQAALDESTRRFSLWWQQHTEARRRLLAGADGCGDNGTSLLAAPAQLAVGVEERDNNDDDNDDDDDAVAVPASVAALMVALHDHVDTLPSPLAAADGWAPLPLPLPVEEGEWEVAWGVNRPSDDKAEAEAAVAEVAPTLRTHTEADLPTAAAVATSLPTPAKAKAVTASLQPESWRQWGKDIDWGKMRAQGSLPLPPPSYISSSSAPHRCAIGGLNQGATSTAARRATPRPRASHASSHPHARHTRCPSRRRCWHPPPPAPLPRRPRPRLPKRRPTGPCRRWGSPHCSPRQPRPPTSRPRFPNWRRPPPAGRSTARKWAWRR